MRAFGRDVAAEVIGGVGAAIVIGAGLLISSALRQAVASFLESLSLREGTAWILAVVFAIAFAVLFVKQRNSRTVELTPAAPTAAAAPRVPGRAEIKLLGGLKPSLMITHRGGPTTYSVDGQILRLANGAPNPLPAPFRCQLHLGGVSTGWSASLRDGDWATIVLGSIEDVVDDKWRTVGTVLKVRRGDLRQLVEVADSGAIIELTIKANPPLAAGGEMQRVCVMRDPNSPNAIVVPFHDGTGPV